MKIYINNEEVLCASNMVIKEQLKNTSSVILNNVYPKSWETDKDYVSRFYMPKDYSPCRIIDENITSETEYNLSNNINVKEQRSYTASKIIFHSTGKLNYIKLIPGKTYKINFTNLRENATTIWETDSFDIGSEINALTSAAVGTNNIDITPTKKYVFIWYNYGTFNSIKLKTSNNLVFAGVVKNSGNIELNPRYPHYSTLQLLDYKLFLSEGNTLNRVLKSQTISSAIKNIIGMLEGFMVGDVELFEDSTLAAYNCNEKSPYDVFEYIAEITGSIWYTKTIDNDITLISFYSVDNLPKRDTLNYNQNDFIENNIRDISYSYNTKDYRNKQEIVSDKATSGIVQTEYITYEGENFQTTYPISSIVSIKSGSSNYSVASDLSKRAGVYAAFYYSYDNNTITSNINLELGRVYEIKYYSVVETRQTAYNQNEIDRISNSTGRNGIISRYEKRTDTSNESELNKIAQSYINFKGIPEVVLTIKTYEKDILNIGDRIYFNGPLDSLKTTYLVIEKEIEMIVAGDQQTIFYTYKLNSSFNDENSINYFDNQRRKLSGNIKEGQYIPRYLDLISLTNIIFFDLSIANIEIPGDILDGVLDIELVGQPGNNVLNTPLNFKI